MTPLPPPDALLLLSSHCPHCPAVLAGLVELVKRGGVGRLEAVNIEIHPARAAELGVRSVPWLRLGPFELQGALSVGELELWARRVMDADGMADAFHDLLKSGAASQVLRLVAQDPARLAALLPIIANPEASLNVRLGAGMVFEEHADTPALRALTGPLGGLARDDDPRVRADAAHLLGLGRDPGARPYLETLLKDKDPEVREIARESLDAAAG
jgi:thiol-disulfide isomerase/thioredoxin